MELKPLILNPPDLDIKRRLSVTTATDSAIDTGILSIILSCLKNMRLQAKPGRKKTRKKPSIALMTGHRSKNGKINPNNSLTGNNQSNY